MGFEPTTSYLGSAYLQGMTIDLLSPIIHSMSKMAKMSRQMSEGVKTLEVSAHIPFRRLYSEMVLVVSEVLSPVSEDCW